ARDEQAGGDTVGRGDVDLDVSVRAVGVLDSAGLGVGGALDSHRLAAYNLDGTIVGALAPGQRGRPRSRPWRRSRALGRYAGTFRQGFHGGRSLLVSLRIGSVLFRRLGGLGRI